MVVVVVVVVVADFDADAAGFSASARPRLSLTERATPLPELERLSRYVPTSTSLKVG